MVTVQRIQAPLNERTVRMYEGWAHNYALLIDELPDPDRSRWLERLCLEAGQCAHVLEVGSGTGRDAGYLESLGVCVDRTDAAEAFVRMQRDSGYQARRLNIICDDLTSPGGRGYDAIVAMCVLIHIDRHIVPEIIHKIREALCPGGLFLVSVREGNDDLVSDRCFTSVWRPGTFEQLLIDGMFMIEGSGRYVDCDGDVWRTILCRRGGEERTRVQTTPPCHAVTGGQEPRQPTPPADGGAPTAGSSESSASKWRRIARRVLWWLFVNDTLDRLEQSPEYQRAQAESLMFQMMRPPR